MIKEELELINKLDINTKVRFDINVSYNNWLHEYYKTYKKTAPNRIKNLIKKTKILWVKDEFSVFRILASKYLKSGYECPKCGSKKGFIPARYKKIEKLLKNKKIVRAERPRTLSCHDCSFTFNPLSISAYRNLKLDLRIWLFYTFISDDGNIDYPLKSIANILKVSYRTAKRIKQFTKEGGRKFTDLDIEKYFQNKNKDHYMCKIILQQS